MNTLDITIKQKFIAAGVLVFLTIISILIISQSTTHTLKDYDAVKIAITQLELDLLMLRRNEKDFLTRKDLKYREKFKNNYANLQNSILKLHRTTAQVGLNEQEVKKVEAALKAYNKSFYSLVKEQQNIGLNAKDGLYGALRQAVHDAEERINASGKQLLRANLLQLRRNEKDFMLRLNTKYLDKFNQNITVFKADLKNSDLSAKLKTTIVLDMDNYQSDFHALVKSNQTKGLTSSEGLRGAMREKVHNAEQLLGLLSSQLDDLVQEEVGGIDHFLALTNMMGIGLAMFVVFVLIWLCRSILTPINSVMNTILRISEENDLSLRVEAGLNDEIGRMGVAFNKLLEEFQAIIVSVNQSSFNVTNTSVEMKVIADKTMIDLSEQQNQTEQVAMAMNEMSATVQEVAKNAVEASECAFHANEESCAGKEIVDISTQTICQIANQIETAAVSIRRVENDSDRIGTILEVIKGIADQTNLLALNAAIEAARAGELGRGFAVVADEVRTLASRTQESTQEIQEMVESLQTGAKQAVNLMEESRDKTQDGVEQSTKAGKALQKIVVAVEKINDMNVQIASATEEHGAVSETINVNITAINSFTKKSLLNTERFVKSTDDIMTTVGELEKTVSQFK